MPTLDQPGKRLEVFLIHWYQPEWIASSIRSISASIGITPHVTILDNGSADADTLRRAVGSEVTIERMPGNLGYAGAGTLALTKWLHNSASEYCIVGSHDLHVEPEALALLVQVADREPRFGILGPVLTAPEESSGGVWYGRAGEQLPIGNCSGLVERDWISGTCMLFRRACVAVVGGFDTTFGSYVEDVDICLRAGDAGWKVGIVCEARAYGLGSGQWLARASVSPNAFLLVKKRRGFLRALPVIGDMVVDIVRSGVGSYAPWRSTDRRRQSRVFLQRHLRAFVLLFRRAVGLLRKKTAE